MTENLDEQDLYGVSHSFTLTNLFVTYALINLRSIISLVAQFIGAILAQYIPNV